MVQEGAAVSPKTASTAEAFRPGHPAFLRTRDSSEADLALVYCQGYEQPAGLLHVQWSKEAAGMGPVPEAGQEVKCHVVNKGVLYTAQGKVWQVSEGPLPLIKLKAGTTCLAVALRKHQRYLVLGCCRIGGPLDEGSLSMKTFEPMDLSFGGFGVRLPQTQWKAGSVLPFTMKSLAEHNGAPIIDLPCLELCGTVTLRRRSRPSADGMVSVGFAFQSLPGQQRAKLECWLSTVIGHLREV